MTRDSLWGSGAGIRLMTSGFTVAPTATLTLAAGTVIQNYGSTSVFINGDLVSQGTAQNPVVLTHVHDQSPYGGTDDFTGDFYTDRGYWNGLTYGPGTTANLTGMIIRHALIGVIGQMASVSGVTFDQDAVGVDASSATSIVTISGNAFTNGGGVSTQPYSYSPPFTVPVILSGNTFSGAYSDITTSAALTVDGNSFQSGSRLSVSSSNAPQVSFPDVSVTGNTFSGAGNYASFGGTLGALQLSSNSSDGINTVPFYLSVTLTRNSLWGPGGGIHLTSEGFTIASGAALTLAAGTVIQCYGALGDFGYRSDGNIVVNGGLVSQGTSVNPVVLTHVNDQSPFGGVDSFTNSSTPDHGYWNGLVYGPGTVANLQGMIIRHAYQGVTGQMTSVSEGTFDQGGMSIDVTGATSALTISNNTFTGNYNGISGTNQVPVVIINNGFRNDGGISLVGISPLTISDNSIDTSSLYITSARSCDLSLISNSFTNVSSSGITLAGTFGQLQMNGNIGHSSSDGKGGTNLWVPFYLNSVTLTKASTWNPQDGVHLIYPAYNNRNDLTVAAGASLTLGAGMVIQFEGIIDPWDYTTIDCGLAVKGSLISQGTASRPVILTRLADQTPYGGQDTSDPTSGGPYWSPYWRGITYSPGTTANLANITIRHGYIGVAADTANLDTCTFTQNSTGVLVNNGGGTYRNCSFMGNGMAVQNNSTTVVDARGNFWGDPSGPYNAKSNPGGKGNPVSDYVLVGSFPPVIAFLTFPSPVSDGTIVTATVTLSSPALTDVVVGLSSSDSSIVRLHRAVVIPAGSISATFPINTYRSQVTKTVTIQAVLDQVVQTKDLTITGN